MGLFRLEHYYGDVRPSKCRDLPCFTRKSFLMCRKKVKRGLEVRLKIIDTLKKEGL